MFIRIKNEVKSEPGGHPDEESDQPPAAKRLKIEH
jgi:hypothetical protein